MIFSKINYKNKKRKIAKNNLKNGTKHGKKHYAKLKVVKTDKIIIKLANGEPNLFPEYKIYESSALLIALSKKVASKINSQTAKYRGAKGQSFVEFLAYDCAKQIIVREQINVFQYIDKQYGLFALNKKEWQMFPYLLCDKILLSISHLSTLLLSYSNQIEFGANYSSDNVANFSLANIYGLIKYNKNFAKIGHNAHFDYKKCVFLFIGKLIKIQNKLDICIKYLKFISRKFNIIKK